MNNEKPAIEAAGPEPPSYASKGGPYGGSYREAARRAPGGYGRLYSGPAR